LAKPILASDDQRVIRAAMDALLERVITPSPRGEATASQGAHDDVG
jgi:hypothetical protein